MSGSNAEPMLSEQDQFKLDLLNGNVETCVQFAMIVLNLFSVCFYVYEAYEGQSHKTLIVDFVVALLFILNALHKIMYTKSWFKRFFNRQLLLDIFTVVPILVAMGDWGHIDKLDAYVNFNFLRCAYIYIVWNVFRLQWPLSEISEFPFQLARVVYLLLCIAFICGGFFFETYKRSTLYDPPLELWHCIYWAFVTLSSVGYGDIFPLTGRLGEVCSYMFHYNSYLCCAYASGKLSEYVTECSQVWHGTSFLKDSLLVFDRYAGTSRARGHIIICGNINFERLADFFMEFYHEDNGYQDTHAVVVTELYPNSFVERFLNVEFFSKRVTFLIGNCADPIVMKNRANLAKAAAVFVFSMSSSDPMVADRETLVITYAIRKFSADVPIYVSLANLFTQKLLLGYKNVYTVHSIEKMQKMIIGYNAVCPGFSAIFYNLFATIRDAEDSLIWKSQYLEGAGNEVYCFELEGNLKGSSFTDVVMTFFEKYSLLVIGLSKKAENTNKTVLINPGPHYIITGCETLFVLAQSKSEVTNMKFYFDVDTPVIQARADKADFTPSQTHKCGDEPAWFGGDKEDSEPIMKDTTADDNPEANRPTLRSLFAIPHRRIAATLKRSITLADVSSTQVLNVIYAKNQENPDFEDLILSQCDSLTVFNTRGFNGHIILCTEDCSSTSDVITTIRKADQETPIVILTPGQPKLLFMAQNISKVNIVKGSMRNPFDLERAGIRASKVVIISSPDFLPQQQSDAAVILTYLVIKRFLAGSLTDQPRILLELSE
ncbi:calcium-activated potassium channel subunit alpha-1 [Pelomyxa schiedti]|nr:calcium-activated potassium channel subunit alpha-1 [Pelomyxa schiedti]